MRNLIAVIVGAITSFLMMAVIAFLMMRLDIKPFSDFAMGKVNQAQFYLVAQEVVFLYALLIVPLIALIAGVVTASIARNKEYLLGLLCIVPMFFLFLDFSTNYFLMVVIASILMLVGVRVIVYCKMKRRAYIRPT